MQPLYLPRPQITYVPVTLVGLVSSKDTMNETKPRVDKGRLLRQPEQVLKPRHTPFQWCDLGKPPSSPACVVWTPIRHCPPLASQLPLAAHPQGRHLLARSHNCPCLQPGKVAPGSELPAPPGFWINTHAPPAGPPRPGEDYV